jgi:hypothetical protein
MKITRSGECGNSPKNAFVEDFIIALIRGDDLADKLTGGAALPEVGLGEVTALKVVHAISHGKVGAGNAEATVGDAVVAFAVVLEFANSKGDKVRAVSFYRAG